MKRNIVLVVIIALLIFTVLTLCGVPTPKYIVAGFYIVIAAALALNLPDKKK